MYGILLACQSVYHVSAWYQQRRALDLLGLDLQIFVSHSVGARNPTQAFWKSSPSIGFLEGSFCINSLIHLGFVL